MNERLLTLLACGTVGALALTACGSGGSSSGGPVTLELVAADYGDKASNGSELYWSDLARRFESTHPKIKVRVQVVSWNDIDERVKTMIRDGEHPDVVQTGGYADKVADKLLYRADEVLSGSTLGKILPTFAKAGEVDGVQYGIPFVSSARAFFYNKAIFAKAGVGEPPKSWEDVRKAAELIKAKVPGVVPYALPLGPEEAQAESTLWELGNGGGIADGGGYTLDSEANVETFGWLKANLVTPKLTYAKPAATDRKTAFADFAAGRTAMLNGHPSLIQQAKDGKIDYGVAPIPGRTGALKSTLGVADWTMAFKKNGHREQIKQFLDFVYDAENTLAFDELYNLMPVTQDTLDAMTLSGNHKDLEPFFALLPQAAFYPLGDTGWDKVSADIKKNVGGALDSPAKVLGELQARAKATGPAK
ncbi:extracellular solute-binding protein [Kitasatospora sp. NPDC051853]|uniref:extracellular solute-binding protein n=1 Tax=Kitasatospora sp. NPDC051853 TaxID=3364058 RepID=UPI0037A1E1B3